MRKSIIAGGSLVLGLILGMLIQPLISDDNVFDCVKKFDRVLNIVERDYVDTVDTKKLTEIAIRAMLDTLDPHTVYISAEDMKAVNEDFQGSFDGIGVEFDIVKDTLTVVTPIPGGPSEALGIRSGDRIVKVNDTTVVGINRNDVPKKLRGPKGTKVKLDVKRAGQSELLTFNVVRDKIPLNSVETSYIIDGTNIGYISVNRFMATTHDEVVKALTDLKSQGMKNILLDLRGNPGGYLDQAEKLANEFLSKGDTIVYTISRISEFNETSIATGGNEWENMPMVILIDAGSASASEIVSGAIQDHDRGLIVGETSFGKGLVQRQFPLQDGSAFRLTISHYYTPSGRCIQRNYEDKNEYRRLAGRLELEPGSYIDHSIDKYKKQVEKFNTTVKNSKEKINIDSLPLFKTDCGRIVFGAGGITPDVIVKSDTIQMMSRKIRSAGIFMLYCDDYYRTHENELKSKYQNNFSDFLKNFVVTDDMMKGFKKIVEANDIKWDDKDAKIDDEFYRISIKSTIAKSLWGRSKSMQVFSSLDNMINTAVKYFPDAAKLVQNKGKKK